MAKKADAPDPPDYDALVQGSLESAEIWADVAREQLDWAREQDSMNRGLLEQVLGVQLPQMEQAFEQAQADRARYEQVYQPVEDDLVREFQTVGTQEDKDRYAAMRAADVRTQFEAQRVNQMRMLEDYGIDPSQTRSQALDLGFRAQEAAAAALAANQGRNEREQLGRALRSEAINIGRGYPAQVAQAQGIVNQTAGGAVGNAANMTAAGANAYNSALGAGSLSQGGYMNAGNLQNMGYQNRMDQWNANASATNALWSGIGSLTGAGMGMFSFGGGAEGGEVPEDLASTPQPGDQYPVMLAEDEFVIPADVVKRKGTEFFDKLLDKYKDGGEYEAKRADGQRSAIPAG